MFLVGSGAAPTRAAARERQRVMAEKRIFKKIEHSWKGGAQEKKVKKAKVGSGGNVRKWNKPSRQEEFELEMSTG